MWQGSQTMLSQKNKTKKIPKGTTVRIVKDVLKMVPSTYSVRSKYNSNYSEQGYFYAIKGGLCPVCHHKWEYCMDLYEGRDLTIAEVGKEGPNYVYELQNKSGNLIMGFVSHDGKVSREEALIFCQHWIRPVKIVRATGSSRLNFVMEVAEENKMEELKLPQQSHITNGIEY